MLDDAMAEDWKLENVLGSKLDVKAARFGANREALRVLMAALRAEEDEIRLGGGTKAAEAQKAKGRLTVRERLKLLLDEGSEFLELGLWAARGMYEEYGGAPAAGVVTGLGRVSGRLCMIIANDATVKAGALWLATACWSWVRICRTLTWSPTERSMDLSRAVMEAAGVVCAAG